MSQPGRPFEILIAEDNAADVYVVREALEQHGVDCELHLVSDGAEAISYIKRLDADTAARALDLLILDMHLPKRSGEEVLRCLRSTERLGHAPVIVMTGADRESIRRSAMEDAALNYFQKPCTLQEFLQLGGLVRRTLGLNTEGDGRSGSTRNDDGDKHEQRRDPNQGR